MTHTQGRTQQKQTSSNAAGRGIAAAAAVAESPHMHPAMRLQRALGNQGVQQLLQREEGEGGGTVVPRKLTVGMAGDAYEQEAEGVADRVMRMQAPALQRTCACGGRCEKCRAGAHDHEGEVLQASAAHGSGMGQKTAPPIVHEALRSPGQPLNPAATAFFEPRFGYDFGSVRVHTDHLAAQSAQAVGARAYTVGSDIVFGAGRYAPESTEGAHLLAHELTHVVQQGSAGAGMLQRSPEAGDWSDEELAKLAAEASRFPMATHWNTPSPGAATQQDADDGLRFTGRFFPSGERRDPCPDCHAAVNTPRLATAPPDRRVTDARLAKWALDVGTEDLLTDVTMLHLQLHPGSEEALVAGLGQDLMKRVLASHEFEGPADARDDGALSLALSWNEVGVQLRDRLSMWAVQNIADAIGRAPAGSELELDPSELQRIRTAPYRGITPVGRHGQWASVGQRYGNMIIADIYQPMMMEGAVWVTLHNHPIYYYTMPTQAFRKLDPFVAEVSRQVVENTKFAAGVLPFLIKMGGFSLGLSGRLAFVVAGIVMDEFAEEMERDMRGERPRSITEILTSAGTALLVDRVTNRLFGHGLDPLDAAASRIGLDAGGTKAFSAAEEKAVTVIRKEIAAHEAPDVATALRRGGARNVDDPVLRGEGYVLEVKIVKDGQEHVYRQLQNGRWCRFSTPICELHLGDDVARAAASPTEQALAGTRERIQALGREQSVIEGAYNKFRDARTLGGGRIDARHLTQEEREVLSQFAPDEQVENLTLRDLRDLAGGSGRKERAREFEAGFREEAALIRQLRDEARPLYDKMRAASPRERERQAILRESRGLDAVSGGSPRSNALHVDHVVPLEEIVHMDGFTKLRFDDQVEIVNDMKNLRAVDAGANSSRGSRSWAEWPNAQNHYDAAMLAKMRALETELREHLRQRIAAALKRRN